MRHIGLFAGIGGFELAARWMGWNTIAWSEWDPFCQKVLSYHFPEAKGYGDIKQADFTQYRGQCDILTSQASASAKKMSDIFGRKCLGLLEKYGQAGLLERMFAGYLVGMKVWYSKRCALTWKVKDTKSKRLLFQLQASVLRTDGTGFGLLLTPTTTERCEHPDIMRARAIWKGYRNGTKYNSLSSQVTYGMLPTPKTQDSRHAMRDRSKSNLGEEMSELAFQNTGKTSQLSPLFVEEMMGFPRNWTVLPFQSGERKA